MNNGSKLKSGWLAILNNEKQMLSSTGNVKNVNRVRTIMHCHANSKVWKGSMAIQSAVKLRKMSKQSTIFVLVSLNSSVIIFYHMNKSLCSRQSGIPASETLAADFKSAKVDGVQTLKQFLEECVYSTEKSLYDQVPRSKRLHFSIQEVKKVENDKLKWKTEQMDPKYLASVLHLVDQGGSLKFEQVRFAASCNTRNFVPLQCQWHNAKGSEKQVTWKIYKDIDTRSWYIHNDCRYGPNMAYGCSKHRR